VTDFVAINSAEKANSISVLLRSYFAMALVGFNGLGNGFRSAASFVLYMCLQTLKNTLFI
jgi:hypothetical protein